MASNYVRDTAAAKKISAYVILTADGIEAGKVLIHHGEGRTLVNAWSYRTEANEVCDNCGLPLVVVRSREGRFCTSECAEAFELS